MTGPNGFDELATFLSQTSNSDGSVVSATYEIQAPGGPWSDLNLGTYTIAMEPNQVSDSHGNYVAAGTLLSFNPSDPSRRR